LHRAAVRRVVGEPRHLELVRLDDVMALADPELDRELARRADLGLRHRRRHRRDRVRTLADRVDRDAQQERRVHAARERDHHVPVPGQGLAQHLELGHRPIT
jgi:hypothetical protein